jgi:predicted nucleic acid-binding protein
METYFFDNSALVKRYTKETGSKWVIDLLKPSAKNVIILARITGVEVTSALVRRQAKLLLPTVKSAKSIYRFQRDFRKRYVKVNLTPTLTENAMQTAEKHRLRGYDAVQLASALEANQNRQTLSLSPIIFVSADSDLNTAAQDEGLVVENPNNYP